MLFPLEKMPNFCSVSICFGHDCRLTDLRINCNSCHCYQGRARGQVEALLLLCPRADWPVGLSGAVVPPPLVCQLMLQLGLTAPSRPSAVVCPSNFNSLCGSCTLQFLFFAIFPSYCNAMLIVLTHLIAVSVSFCLASRLWRSGTKNS